MRYWPDCGTTPIQAIEASAVPASVRVVPVIVGMSWGPALTWAPGP